MFIKSLFLVLIISLTLFSIESCTSMRPPTSAIESIFQGEPSAPVGAELTIYQLDGSIFVFLPNTGRIVRKGKAVIIRGKVKMHKSIWEVEIPLEDIQRINISRRIFIHTKDKHTYEFGSGHWAIYLSEGIPEDIRGNGTVVGEGDIDVKRVTTTISLDTILSFEIEYPDINKTFLACSSVCLIFILLQLLTLDMGGGMDLGEV